MDVGYQLEVASGIRHGFVVEQHSSDKREPAAARVMVACNCLRACSGPVAAWHGLVGVEDVEE